MTDALLEPYDARRARTADGLLAAFNDAAVLVAADVHVAQRLAALTGESDETVLLAAALAVRGPRLGHTCVDLATIATTATVDVDEDVDLAALPWPEPSGWLAALRSSALVAVGEEGAPDDRPLRLVDTTLYLDRYWREERQVAADLSALRTAATDVDAATLTAGLDAAFPRPEDADQRRAAALAIERRFAVIGGGPGTGKTTTVARIVALLFAQAEAAGRPAPLIAMAAPTARAAAQLEAAVRDPRVWAGTLHRLLGGRPGTTRYRHNRGNRLPHDVVIVDESSMVELSMMARLVQAIRPTARLLLVGDPNQLTPVGAGAVLADIVGAGTTDDVVLLEHIRRFGGEIAAVADAIRRGDADATVAALRDAGDTVTWLEVDADDPAAGAALAPLRERVVATQRAVVDAAGAGDARAALEALRGFRLMCAHRRGPYGVGRWTVQIETWLEAALPGGTFEPWYLGRPLLITRNDPALRLSNGDLGVVVRTGDAEERAAAFARGGDVVEVRPSRLEAVETVHAMTIHKSQGSQFDTAAVLLPAVGSRLLTRELLYTAVTRARRRLLLVGTEDSVRAAVTRPVARASGLGPRLRG
jgi:exodeoxyribonuclease V alpha subunit